MNWVNINQNNSKKQWVHFESLVIENNFSLRK